MLGKENTRKQIADNQMDYVDSESTIEPIGVLNHEDRLSSEELQCGRSQESFGVPRSSDISLTNIEIVEKATLFVKIFVKEFEEKLSECSKEARPGSSIRKTGKVVDKVASAVSNYIPPSMEKVGASQVMECVGFISANQHRKKAKIFSTIAVSSEGNLRKILVDASLEIFKSFERQFIRIMDAGGFFWKRGIEKLAIDAVSRVINYISANVEKEEFSVDLITRGVVLGESKRKYPFTTRAGHQVKDKQSDKTLITSQLYKAVGIKKIEG